MSANTYNDPFLNQLREIILKNLSDESFGVSELANAVAMSRSSLLRKIQKATDLSASQYIRQVRLEEGKKLLEDGTYNISEIAFEVGFNSTSYFVKCFREQYGYPPGEYSKVKEQTESSDTFENPVSASKRKIIIPILGAIIILLAIWVLSTKPFQKRAELDNSIAVLPFINDSNDSTNVYFINGLMESILSNLQQIEELKVISRTSSEKYRYSTKSIPEIAEELGVSYILEGSGQKVGDKILLNIQLIDARNDNHLWAEQYNRQIQDVFDIQIEVANKIAEDIEVIITPEEKARINQKPTENLQAYDYFLKGLEYLKQETMEGLDAGIPLLIKAIEEDPEFATAHAALAVAYYYKDFFQVNKIHIEKLNFHADKALFYDPQNSLGLTAKGFYYQQIGNSEQAVVYLEEALKYNPNLNLALNTICDIYTNYIPDTEKYLQYALKGISIDIASNDSVAASYLYLHLSNALIQAGFVSEALVTVDKSLGYNPDNLFSEYVKAYILYAKNRDLNETKRRMVAALKRDTTRFDIIQEIGNICYYQRDFDCAYTYFKHFVDMRKSLNLNIYAHRDLEISYVFEQKGITDESQTLLKDFRFFAENEESIYQHMFMGLYYAYLGDKQQALKHLWLFTEEENFQYWIILFLPLDPVVDGIKDDPEFKAVMEKLEKKFWDSHAKTRSMLEEKDLLTI